MSRPIVVIVCMDWLLRIVGALTAPTFMALACRWRSRPQLQLRTCRRIRLCARSANRRSSILLLFGSILEVVSDTPSRALMNQITFVHASQHWENSHEPDPLDQSAHSSAD